MISGMTAFVGLACRYRCSSLWEVSVPWKSDPTPQRHTGLRLPSEDLNGSIAGSRSPYSLELIETVFAGGKKNCWCGKGGRRDCRQQGIQERALHHTTAPTSSITIRGPLMDAMGFLKRGRG